MKPKCVFCSQKGGKLIAFSEKSLRKCNDEILKIRVDNSLSMNCINLATAITEDCKQTYHSQCYQKFTALPPKKYRPKVVV